MVAVGVGVVVGVGVAVAVVVVVAVAVGVVVGVAVVVAVAVGMSKETMQGSDCAGCGQRIIFDPYHVPHCPNTKASPIIERLQQQTLGKIKTTTQAQT